MAAQYLFGKWHVLAVVAEGRISHKPATRARIHGVANPSLQASLCSHDVENHTQAPHVYCVRVLRVSGCDEDFRCQVVGSAAEGFHHRLLVDVFREAEVGDLQRCNARVKMQFSQAGVDRAQP